MFTFSTGKKLWKELFSPSGRRNRKPYILFRLLLIVPLSNGIYRTAMRNASEDIIFMMLITVLIVDGFGLINDIKRAHDLNISGKIPCIFFVIYVAAFALQDFAILVIPQMVFQIYMMFKKGTVGPNKYGPDPLEEIKNVEKDKVEK